MPTSAAPCAAISTGSPKGIANELTSRLGSTAWMDPDASNFRSEWDDGQYRSYLS